jgi:hypothetical protein
VIVWCKDVRGSALPSDNFQRVLTEIWSNNT